MRKGPENRTIDTISAKIPIEKASIIVFFKFSFAPTSEYRSIAARSVRRKLMFAVVTVRSINDLATLDIPKGVMDARVQAPLTNNIRSDTRISQTEGFSSLISSSDLREMKIKH